MTDYTADIDKTEGLFGVKFSATVGSGGVTKGLPVKISADRTVVATSGATDVCVGIAKDTVAEGGAVTVLGNGCLVKVPFTLTVGARVGISTGNLADYSSGTVVGTTVVGATSASIVRVNLQHVMA